MTHLMIDEWTRPIDVQSLLSFHTSNRGSNAERLKAVIAHPYGHLSIITPPMTIYDANTRFRLNTEYGALIKLGMPSAQVDQRKRFNPSHGAFCQCTSCTGRWLHDDESVRPCGCSYEPLVDSLLDVSPAMNDAVQQHHFRHFIDDVDRLLRTKIFADSEPIGLGGLSVYRSEVILKRTFESVTSGECGDLDVMECRAEYGQDIPIYNADEMGKIRSGQRCRVRLEYMGPRFLRCSSYWNKWRAVGVYVEPNGQKKRDEIVKVPI
jgi:hypothetical protein